ncbi:MAG: cell division protein FtsA [Saprospiraceae bacterium]|nr:cell division protein FtsA [Candidatus Vicinibacter affinis]MBP6173703.1 cell division protein FtsA [Saprospiraceae bacterium]MBK6572738.1 cell division protein FtsA [Candidatus Vicinibacter affinis]MBK6824516.1 cell division protein FtsA [Candidatus Vicinibacter affinis]MBK7303407.1 cell division protein FtsA [Candidatus Vicinibacter affinis]
MESQINQNPEIIAALDIGTTKVCVVVGKRNILNKIEVLGFGKVSSEGVIRGVVSNIDKTVKAISDAIDLAEKMSKHEIQKVHVGIAGQHIKSLQHQGVLYRNNPQEEITREDVDKLVQDMYKIALPPGDQILHVIPQEFTVDDEEGIIDPVGMSGSRLQSNFHIITGNTSAASNILRCIEKAGLIAESMTLEPLASAESVLSKEEKEAGVVMVDIGGGTTDVTIYNEGIIRYTSVIPIGSNMITKDIKAGCSVTQEQAEKLKVRFGSALSEEIVDNRIITIPGLMGREPKEISEKNLARIIQARVEEIFEYVMWDIHRSGYENKLVAGIVLTGGGSLLKNLELLAEYQTGLAARIGYPTEHLSSHYMDEVSNPMFSTSMGLVFEGMKKMAPIKTEPRKIVSEVFDLVEENVQTTEDLEREEGKREGWLGRFVNKGYSSVKEFFEASPDSEF